MLGFQIISSLKDDGCGHLEVAECKPSKKEREYKGHSANTHVENYCVLDLETTGVFINSAKIIEISALKVRNNEVVSEYSTLVNPKCPIPKAASAINHITDNMVADAPFLDDVIDDFLTFVGEDIIVGYNSAGFDMNIIYDCVMSLRNKPFSNDYVDVLHAVKRTLPHLENSKLETVSKYYDLDTSGGHRASKDCYLTKACYDTLFREFGNTAFMKRNYYSEYQGKGFQYSPETIALQELNNLLASMLCDGSITMDEVDSLRYWVEEHRELSGNFPFDKAFNSLDKVLADGRVTSCELKELKSVFEEIVDPVKCVGCHDQVTCLDGKHVCITGDFDYGPRGAVEKLIVSRGGIIDKSVKRATNYVIVGAQGSIAWKTGNYGTKIQKAMELIDKGFAIGIMEEAEFIPAIQKLEESQ
ncbi:MAG: hypothetical protein MJ075_06725 [Oscillospiraceae bacterium]|nr:hypothetical protein [Oscillospiraceae bacterium]